MKTINLLGKDYFIKKEYEMAICVCETTASRFDNYEDEKIKLGQKIYNVKILETGSIIFTISPDSGINVVTIFPQMFGFPSNKQLTEIEKLKHTISKSQNRISEIYNNIKRTEYTDIKI